MIAEVALVGGGKDDGHSLAVSLDDIAVEAAVEPRVAPEPVQVGVAELDFHFPSIVRRLTTCKWRCVTIKTRWSLRRLPLETVSVALGLARATRLRLAAPVSVKGREWD